MQSKIKLFNKAIFKSTLKLNMWVSILNFALLFLFILMPMMAAKMSYYDNLDTIKNILQFDFGGLQTLILCVVPVILGIGITKFMQNKSQNIHIHSMPIERKQIFTTNIVAGIILLVVPIIINLIGMLSILGVSTFNQLGTEVVNWVYITFALEFITFALTVMIGTIIGTGLMQTIFTYIFMLFPVGIYMLIQFTLKIFVLGYTFKESTIENSIVMKISILPQIFMLGSVDIREKNITENLYLIYIIAAIVIIIASYFIYKVRKVEKTGDVVVFRKLNPIVKYGITFCFMILIGLIVFLMFNDSIEYMISAYVITSVIAYFLAEMLIRKSVRVLDSYKGYSAYVVVMVIIFVGIKMDISGFESRVPDISNVDEVYYDQINNYGVQVVLREKLNKEAILAMHRLILSEKLSKKYRSIGANINLGYKLKNGKIMYREYIIDYTEEEQNAIENLEKIILGSQEYKKQVYEVFRDENVENISKIEISIDGSESKIYIDKKEEMQELLEVMRKDTLEMSYERMNNTHMLSGGISDVIKYVYIQEDSNQGTESRYKYKPKSKSETSINLYYNKSFKSTNNWLKQHNYYPNIQE